MRLTRRLSFLVAVIAAGGGVVALSSSCRSRARAPAATPAIERDLPTLEIEELAIGSGAAAKAGSLVTIHYTGFLGRATFDTSRNRQPLTFRLGGGEVLKGWDEGLVGMKVGGRRRLTIPPDLGYGKKGSLAGAIPPNSTLVFEIELLGAVPSSS